MPVDDHLYSTVDECPTPGCSGTATFDWYEECAGSDVVKRRLTGVVCDADCFADNPGLANAAAEEHASRRNIG
ncbi:MAG: hypothetical protein M3N53_12840 [Actinomycetota bacterium]|nr:hypothetical protein [Actinomycetota bacterium]